MAKSIPYLWPKWLKPIPFGATHTYITHVGEYSSPGKLQVTSSVGICWAFDNFSCLRVVHLLYHASQVCPRDEVSSKAMLSFIRGFQGGLLCCFSLVLEPVPNCRDMRKWLNYVTCKCWIIYSVSLIEDQPHVGHVLSINRSHSPWSTLNGNSIDISVDTQSTSQSMLVLRYECRYHDKISWCHHNDIGILHEIKNSTFRNNCLLWLLTSINWKLMLLWSLNTIFLVMYWLISFLLYFL